MIAVFLASSLFVHAETTFYEAYQAGLQYEGAGKWKDARDRFLEAASLRPTPAHRVRTYGLNFLQDYDPYAHLAHCEFQLGMYEEAKRHLEMSRQAGVVPEQKLQDLKKRWETELHKRENVQTSQPDTIPEPTPPLSEKQRRGPQPAILKTESNPAGATVRIDGEERGVTPLRITLPPGTHSVEYFLQGYESGQQTIDLEDGETQTVKVALSPILPAQQESSQQEQPRRSAEIEAPPDKGTDTSPAAVSANKETDPRQAQEKLGTVPSQTQQAHSGTDLAMQPPGNMRNMLLLLLIVAAVVTFLFLRRHRTSSQEAIVSPTVSAPAARNPAISDDGLTEDLRLGNAGRASTPIPVGDRMLEGIRSRAQQLPEGAPKDLGGYEMMAVLGRGGMGTTFLAKRKRDGLPVALKLPHEHLLDHPEFIQRFLREGSLGATLHHPNIIRILEASKVGNRPFITMELLQGETLENKLRTKGRLPVRDALEVARDVALALDYARLKGIVHRDLKPENIMILDRGGLKVLDYGIARVMDLPGLTSSGTYLGTPSYSAPESTGSIEVDQQSDLYSLGIILYRCLSGSLPFSSNNPLEILDMHRSQSLPPFPPELNIPDSVFRLVQKLTEKDKADRFKNAESFLVELNRMINQLEA